MVEEEWRKIEGTLNHYVSNFGEVKNDKSKVIVYGKSYQKYSKDRVICEEWLKNRRYEIENLLQITKDKIYKESV